MIQLRRYPLAATFCLVGAGAVVGASAQPAGVPLPDRAGLNPMRAISRESLQSFVVQPLFDPSRRPPPAVPPQPAFVPLPPPPILPEPPPALHLLGVVGGDDVVAVVRTASGKTTYLRSGDRLGGWTVRVLPTGLRIQSGERIFDYDLFALPGGDHGPVAVDPKRVGLATAPGGSGSSTLAARGSN